MEELFTKVSYAEVVYLIFEMSRKTECPGPRFAVGAVTVRRTCTYNEALNSVRTCSMDARSRTGSMTYWMTCATRYVVCVYCKLCLL